MPHFTAGTSASCTDRHAPRRCGWPSGSTRWCNPKSGLAEKGAPRRFSRRGIHSACSSTATAPTVVRRRSVAATTSPRPPRANVRPTADPPRTVAGSLASVLVMSLPFDIQRSLYWHERRSALVLDKKHQEFRRLGTAGVPVNDMNIVRAFIEGLSWRQRYLLSTL